MKLILLFIPLLIVFNLFNISSGEVRLYGQFLLFGIFILVGFLRYKTSVIALWLSVLVALDFLIRQAIDLMKNYTVKIDENVLAPIWVQVLGQSMVWMILLIVTLVIGGIKLLIIKSKNK